MNIKIYRLEDCLFNKEKQSELEQWDNYKITLLNKGNIVSNSKSKINLKHDALLFINPPNNYAIDLSSMDTKGYVCIFSKSYFSAVVIKNIETLLLSKNDVKLFRINAKEQKEAEVIFDRMLKEMDSDYIYKHDLLKNYIFELIHLALKSIRMKGLKINDSTVNLFNKIE